MIKISKLFDEICFYKKWKEIIDYESKLTLLRKNIDN